jgi:hypothetical protein
MRLVISEGYVKPREPKERAAREDDMGRYRCYFVGSNGQLVAAETIISESDHEARAKADEIFTRKVYATGYDLHLGDRLVGTQEVKAS